MKINIWIIKFPLDLNLTMNVEVKTNDMFSQIIFYLFLEKEKKISSSCGSHENFFAKNDDFFNVMKKWWISKKEALI